MSTSSSNPSKDGAEASAGRLSRRGLVTGVAAATGAVLLTGAAPPAVSAAGNSRDGSVATAPNLPEGFRNTFESRYVQANGIRQHVVVGGDGPPLLLVHGWPESWYAWRFLMPALAQQYTVIAVDQRGIGMTDKPLDGYDSATLATDLAALMETLGYPRYAVVGHDTGYVISYALAADHRDHVARVALAEIPGPPGVGEHPEGPGYFVTAALNNKLWHIAFNRVDDDLIVNMVRNNADDYYNYEFRIQGGPACRIPPSGTTSTSTPETRTSCGRASVSTALGRPRSTRTRSAQPTQLTIPVLGIGGEMSYGGMAAAGIMPAAIDVQTAVIPGAGHWVAEQAPQAVLDVLTPFLAPYRDGA